MKLRVGAQSDVGRVRKGNEDSFTAREPLFAVADGMGGHQGGEVASSLALEILGKGEGTLEELAREANDAVFRKAAQDPGLSGMGTTLTAVRRDGDVLRLVHVGDSRAYLLRGGTLQQLTKDHTVVERLVDDGRLTPEEAQIHPQRSILTRALGVDEALQVDQGAIEPQTGDRLLLCSDGLTGEVSEAALTQILSEQEDPQAAADALVAAANEAGGQDNITAVVVDVLDSDGNGAGAPPEPSTQKQQAPPAVTHSRARPATGGEDPPRSRRGLVWLGVTIVLVIAALWAIKALWVDNQFFVGEANGHVAIFRGIPAEPLGIDLSQEVEEFADLPAEEIEGFPEYQTLTEGITAASEADARTIIEEMRAAFEAAQPPGDLPAAH